MPAEFAIDATRLELIRTLGMTSAMIVPLTAHNRTVAIPGIDLAGRYVAAGEANEAIIRRLTTIEARFCTAIYGQLTPPGRGVRVAMACAGHLPPRLLRRDGTIEVGSAGGTILGVYAEPKIASEDLSLAPGDTLVLVTDGVTEARGLEGFYGEERLDSLPACSAGRSATSVADLITDDVLRFQVGTPRDDVAVLVVQATEHVAVRAASE